MPRRAAVAKRGQAGRSVSSHARGSGNARAKRIDVPDGAAATGLPMLRTSERSALKKCEFLWDLTYNRRIKPVSEAPALRFGSLVHQALAGYYIPGVTRGVSPVVGFKKAFDTDMKRNNEIFGMRVDEDERWINAEELGLAMMGNYLDEYGKDSDYEVIVTEHPFRTVVKHPETGDPWFIYTGIVDGVWKHRRTREFWIPDHKTTAGIGDRNWTHLAVDDQAGAYWSWGLDYLILEGFLKKRDLNGMLYNIMRKAMPDERQSKLVAGKRQYLNLDGSVSKKQPSPYFIRKIVLRDEFDREEARRRAMIDFKRIELFRAKQLDLSKSPGQFTCPSCPVRDACELHETGNDVEAFLKQTTKDWAPYAEHEIYDGR